MTNAIRRTTEAKERSARAAERIATAQENLVRNFDAFAEMLDDIDSSNDPKGEVEVKRSPGKSGVKK